MCVQYWPASKEKDEEYGGIGVSVLKEEELANFHIRTIRLYKKNKNNVSVFTIFASEFSRIIIVGYLSRNINLNAKYTKEGYYFFFSKMHLYLVFQT